MGKWDIVLDKDFLSAHVLDDNSDLERKQRRDTSRKSAKDGRASERARRSLHAELPVLHAFSSMLDAFFNWNGSYGRERQMSYSSGILVG